MNSSAAPATRRDIAKALPERRAPALAQAQRQPFRVLQTAHAPAQLSLFLRPVAARR